MTILKALKYKPLPSFRAYQKKSVEFTDLTHTIYRPAKADKKDNLYKLINFLYMSVPNIFQYSYIYIYIYIYIYTFI